MKPQKTKVWHSKFVPDEIVVLSSGQLEAVEKEATARLRAYDKLKLRTILQHGSMTPRERQVLGIKGELAFRIYMGLDQAGIASGGLRDGGRDATLEKKSPGNPVKWIVQVKTWAKDTPDMHLYIARHIPLKADVIVGMAAQKAPDAMRIVGFVMSRDFTDRASYEKLGKVEYKALPVSELAPSHALYLMFKGPMS